MRQFDRYAVNAGVSYRSPALGHVALRGEFLDLSLSGGRIATTHPLSPNSWLTLEIDHVGLGLLQTSARVVRPTEGGVGVHFFWTDRKSLHALRDFLAPISGMTDSEREDSTLRKIWGTLLRTSPDSLVNTMISWCNSTFALEEEIVGKEGEAFYEGTSPAIRKVYEKIRLFAPTALPVLLEGETGTGKEVFSRTVHRLSQNAGGPYVPVNCGAIPPTLAESLLFGHEKGSFSGANTRQKGHFEEAEGGTIFLDEIGDLPLQIQVKLLRVLQERAFTRVGSHEEIPLSCRIVAASNKDLKREVREGRFRQDLYYRLEGVAVSIPPLRERTEDILPLARFFVPEDFPAHGPDREGLLPCGRTADSDPSLGRKCPGALQCRPPLGGGLPSHRDSSRGSGGGPVLRPAGRRNPPGTAGAPRAGGPLRLSLPERGECGTGRRRAWHLPSLRLQPHEEVRPGQPLAAPSTLPCPRPGAWEMRSSFFLFRLSPP